MYAFARNQFSVGGSGRTLEIGDSIEHDIRGGSNARLATALVRTGLSDDLSDEALSNRLDVYGAVPDFVLPGLYWQRHHLAPLRRSRAARSMAKSPFRGEKVGTIAISLDI